MEAFSASIAAEGFEFTLAVPMTNVAVGQPLYATMTLSNMSGSSTPVWGTGDDASDTRMGGFLVWDATTGHPIYPRLSIAEIWPQSSSHKFDILGLHASKKESVDIASRYGLTNPGPYWICAWTKQPSTNTGSSPTILLRTPPLLITVHPALEGPASTNAANKAESDWSKRQEDELHHLKTYFDIANSTLISVGEPESWLAMARIETLKLMIAEAESRRDMSQPAIVRESMQSGPGPPASLNSGVPEARNKSVSGGTIGNNGYEAETESTVLRRGMYLLLLFLLGVYLAWWLLRRRGAEPPTSK